MLLDWGDDPNFVLSAGGFHPRFTPPPLPFPEPPRVPSVFSTDLARIRIEGYFAVTSNSVQFGSRAEMFFGVSDFGIDGHLTFDALFQFDPFYFRFALSTSFSVKVFGVGVYSVGYSGLLEGPTPWHIEGKGHISLLFFSISVPFQHTWGSNQDTRLDPIEVMQLADAEFKALSNWEAKIPVASNLNVSLRKLDETETDRLVLHPLGKLRISERKVPINFKLDRVGNKKPKDVNRLKVSATLRDQPACRSTRSRTASRSASSAISTHQHNCRARRSSRSTAASRSASPAPRSRPAGQCAKSSATRPSSSTIISSAT